MPRRKKIVKKKLDIDKFSKSQNNQDIPSDCKTNLSDFQELLTMEPRNSSNTTQIKEKEKIDSFVEQILRMIEQDDNLKGGNLEGQSQPKVEERGMQARNSYFSYNYQNNQAHRELPPSYQSLFWGSNVASNYQRQNRQFLNVSESVLAISQPPSYHSYQSNASHCAQPPSYAEYIYQRFSHRTDGFIPGHSNVQDNAQLGNDVFLNQWQYQQTTQNNPDIRRNLTAGSNNYCPTVRVGHLVENNESNNNSSTPKPSFQQLVEQQRQLTKSQDQVLVCKGR